MSNNIKILFLVFFLLGLMTACKQAGLSTEDGRIMKVKIVSIEKCPITSQTIALVKETANELGLAIKLEHVVVKTPEDAAIHRHLGSPTVQVNGRDIEPAARKINQFGVT